MVSGWWLVVGGEGASGWWLVASGSAGVKIPPVCTGGAIGGAQAGTGGARAGVGWRRPLFCG